MHIEMWKPVPFASGYLASSHGNIIGRRTHLMKLTPNYRGYLVVSLNYIQHRVNRVICRVFHGEPPTSEHEAAHKDANKQNNRETNLYWATAQQNADDLSDSGVNKGSNSWKAMFTDDQIRYIRTEYTKGYSIMDLSKEFPEACYATISHIVHRRTYKDVQ